MTNSIKQYSKRMTKRFTQAFYLCTCAALLAACGSGLSTEDLPNTAGSSTSANYSGPAPSTDDVQAFKLNVWDNLVDNDRCGSCHGTGGQSPTFVHADDINIAYAQANTVINLNDAAQSAMVTKVGGGHNCWLQSDSACADTLTSYIENWAGGSSGSQNQVVLRAPQIKDPGATKVFPESSANFTGVHNLLTTYCSTCHIEGIQTPFIASNDIDVSYAAAQSRIDLETPSASRLVQRLRTEFHNCWDGDCPTASGEMQDEIEAFTNNIDDPEDIDEDLVTSKALSLTIDGIAANTGGRFEDHVIALYEFKTGDEFIAYDTSGVEPALNLTLSGNVDWVGGWGIQIGAAYTDEETSQNIGNGKAQGKTADSKKLFDQITATGEYSIEAWVVPNNVSQEESRIITYSGSSTERNVALGQTLYNYDFLQRSTTTDQNESFSTADGDERLQATLQHVVVTFSPGQARKIYVNGEYTDDVDAEAAGLLNEWDDSFAFVLGNETDGNSLWQGTLRMVAIHNRSLNEEQILQNYSVGVGEKFFLLFSLSHLIDVPSSFMVFEVSQFDSYSYLFTDPFFISLDENAVPNNIPVQGIKIGINGKEATVGQAYKNLDTTLDASDYIVGSGQVLSNTGTIITLELGADLDEFFLSFEVIGTHTNVVVEALPPTPPEPADLEPAADIGLKTFDEINASMSVITGVPGTESDVYATYQTIRQQLPSVENIGGFLSAHQMAVTQLAIQYCSALIESSTWRSAIFPAFDFDESYTTAFDADGKTDFLTPMLNRFVGTSLASQPTQTNLEEIIWDGYTDGDGRDIDGLVTTLTTCASGCDADRTKTVAKASCAAVLGSAVTLVQ